MSAAKSHFLIPVFRALSYQSRQSAKLVTTAGTIEKKPGKAKTFDAADDNGVCTQAVAPAKHAVQTAIVALFFPITDCGDEEVIVGTAYP